jgi:hypothetical protein
MTTWLRSSSEELRSLLTGMKNTPWSWEAAEVGELCRRLGWTLIEVLKSGSAVADAGLVVPGGQILILARDGKVDDICVSVTENVRDAGAGGERFIGDAFADAAAAGVAVLGEPTGRQRSEPPTVRWRLDDTSTVLVKNLEIAVTVTWASNRFQDDWDRISDALA